MADTQYTQPHNTPPHTYTTNQNTSAGGSSGTGIAFVVGILVAVVAVVAYFLWAEPANEEVNVTVDVPASVERAADDLGDAATAAGAAIEDAAEDTGAAVERATE